MLIVRLLGQVPQLRGGQQGRCGSQGGQRWADVAS